MAITKKAIFKAIILTLWIAAGMATIVLLVAAIKTKNTQPCKAVIISISGNELLNAGKIKEILYDTEGGVIEGKAISEINIRRIESVLQQNVWIKHAEIYFDNTGAMLVKVKERKPVARIFTMDGNSFYADEEANKLPLSDTSIKVPVFTSFPVLNTVADSILMKQIVSLGISILNQPFWMAQIEQIDITTKLQFEMIPKLGEHIIRFGDASDIKGKFRKLLLFYKQVMNKTGWNKYSVIDIQYRGQVVATKRGSEVLVNRDTLLYLQRIQQILDSVELRVRDTMYAQPDKPNDMNTNENTEIGPNDNSTDYKAPSEEFRSRETNNANLFKALSKSISAVNKFKNIQLWVITNNQSS